MSIPIHKFYTVTSKLYNEGSSDVLHIIFFLLTDIFGASRQLNVSVHLANRSWDIWEHNKAVRFLLYWCSIFTQFFLAEMDTVSTCQASSRFSQLRAQESLPALLQRKDLCDTIKQNSVQITTLFQTATLHHCNNVNSYNSKRLRSTLKEILLWHHS